MSTLQRTVEFSTPTATPRGCRTSCFLADIIIQLWYMSGEWWSQCGIDLLGASCAFRNTYTEVYYNGYGLFDRRGGRTSLTFIPAAQQDLIIITLEVLARSPVANAAASQREAFRDVHIKIVQTAMTVMTQAQAQADSAGGCPASSRLLVFLRKLRTKCRLYRVDQARGGTIQPCFSMPQNAAPYAGQTSSLCRSSR